MLNVTYASVDRHACVYTLCITYISITCKYTYMYMYICIWYIYEIFTESLLTVCGQWSKCFTCINQCNSHHFTDMTTEVTEPGSGKASIWTHALWLQRWVQSIPFNSMVDLVCWVLVLITTGTIELVVGVGGMWRMPFLPPIFFCQHRKGIGKPGAHLF